MGTVRVLYGKYSENYKISCQNSKKIVFRILEVRLNLTLILL
jgi:hypothetical protein